MPKKKMQNPTTTPSQKSILANQLQKLQDLMPKPKLLQGVFMVTNKIMALDLNM